MAATRIFGAGVAFGRGIRLRGGGGVTGHGEDKHRGGGVGQGDFFWGWLEKVKSRIHHSKSFPFSAELPRSA